MQPLAPAKMNSDASKACRMNNQKKMADETENLEKGGNKEEYLALVGEGKSVDCEECTIIAWAGSATELVVLNLVEGWAQDQKHPILDPKLALIGMAFNSHKKHENVV